MKRKNVSQVKFSIVFFIVKSRKCGVFLGVVFGSRTVPFQKVDWSPTLPTLHTFSSFLQPPVAK